MRFFNLVFDFFENGYSSKAMCKVAEEIRQICQAEGCDIFLFENKKDELRLVGTTRDESLTGTTKVSIKELQADENREVYDLKLPGKLLGVVVLYKPKGTKVEDILEELSISLDWVQRYFQILDDCERYRNMTFLTELFYGCNNPLELKEQFTNQIAQILKAEVVMFFEKEDDNYVFSCGYGVDKGQLLTSMLPSSHPLVGKIAKEPDGILQTKPKIDFISFECKSMVATPVNLEDKLLGLLIVVNKIQPKGYRPSYSFDQTDLQILKEAARRFSLAFSRLIYQQNLAKQIETLKKYTQDYEKLIEEQRIYLKKMDLVHAISNAMRSSYDLTNVYKILLLGLTSGRSLGFNRAMLLIRNRKIDALEGKFWLGPLETDNIEQIWKEAERRALNYGDLSQYLREEAMMLDVSKGLTERIAGKLFFYKEHPIFERVVLRRKLIHVTPELAETLKNSIKDLLRLLDVDEFVVVPLIGKWDTIGVVILDNKFTKASITQTDIEILRLIADSAGLAIENAMNYEELRKKTESLEQQKNMIDYLRKFSESILQNLSTAVVVLDKSGKIIECNKMVESIFGLPREAVIGRTYDEFGPAYQDLFGVAMKVFETGEPISLSNYMVETVAGERYFDVKYSPMWENYGETLMGVIVTLDDVTEQYKMEQERKSKEKLILLGEVAARVAHELRNPITVLGGFLNRLKKNISDPVAREKYLEILSREIEHLQEIVNEILDFSKTSVKIDRVKFQLNELINEVIVLMNEKASKQGITIEFQPSPIPEIFADRNRIKRVLINLIQNAIEASPENGKVVVRTFYEQGKVITSVFNTGEPIKDEVARKLFTPFFTTKTYGTGLGLPICKKIVEDEHGGRIWVEPRLNGTEFFFELPVEKEGEDGKTSKDIGR
ncbi:sensor histidine kinase [Pseudothermotoga thermarum]|uniref:histidine kinase n=1 Tax=Pseudothermotoga thermarum DSM 5069 TaxID=688269 RepID=F7YVP9_9THEM|nr:sensor histidine kinase [Pseudothermotoga thermarum]AEH51714.1 multi-sensor signal transduction histidine kinase [Pseudothermotoga thermarum DSM 5069]